MASPTFFNSFFETLTEVVNCGSDQFVVALTNNANAPSASSHSTLSDLTTISYTNLSSRNLTTSSSSQTSGTYTLVLADLTLTASSGSVAAFQYLVIYDDTPTSPADPLCGYYSYGSDLTLGDGESLTLDFASSFFSLAIAA